MAADMFEPLRAEELTDVRVPRRLLNYGGLIDVIIQRIIELLRSLPTIPLWLTLVVILPPHWRAAC